MPLPALSAALEAAGVPVLEWGPGGWSHTPEYIWAWGRTGPGSIPQGIIKAAQRRYAIRMGTWRPFDADEELGKIGGDLDLA